jgi:hypothetical protein
MRNPRPKKLKPLFVCFVYFVVKKYCIVFRIPLSALQIATHNSSFIILHSPFALRPSPALQPMLQGKILSPNCNFIDASRRIMLPT